MAATPEQNEPENWAMALAVLQEKVEEERRANDLKETELTELRRQNEIARRSEAWMRELATKAGEAVMEMRASRVIWEQSIESLSGTIREQGIEQAEINDHIIDILNRVRDALSYILTRMINGDGKKLKAAIEEVPGHPELRGEYEAARRELQQYRRNLERLKLAAAKMGTADLETANKIEETETEINRLEIHLKKLS